MTNKKAIQQILDDHWNSKRHGRSVDELDVRCGVVAEHAYEQGCIAGLRKAARIIKGSTGSALWLSVMLKTKAREMAKKARAQCPT